MVDVDALRAYAESELARWQVPAVEFVAVRGDDVLLADAFGLRDIAAGLPATPSTLFHHGSTGKAFTGVLAATLVDAGLLEWDRPVREYLPQFRLTDDLPSDRITTADLLAHRSGVARHDFAWIANPSLSRADLVGRLRHLPAFADARTAFGYSNFAYMTVGLLIGELTGSTWEEQMRERVFRPLGMDRTVTSVAGALAAEHAQPYAPAPPGDAAAGEKPQWMPIPWRQSDPIAPAGGVISCATDIARWLRMQVSDGAVDGARVVSAEALAQTHRLHTPIDGPGPDADIWFYGYAFGWLVGTYRGRKLLWHNGGIDGFRTEIALLPDDKLAAAACCNVIDSELPISLVFHALDTLLGVDPKPWSTTFLSARDARPTPEDPTVVEGTRPSHPLEAYAGVYVHPGYGDLQVRVAEGALSARLGELDLDTTYRHYDTWTARYDPLEVSWSITFVTDADGAICAVEMPLEPAVAPIRFTATKENRA